MKKSIEQSLICLSLLCTNTVIATEKVETVIMQKHPMLNILLDESDVNYGEVQRILKKRNKYEEYVLSLDDRVGKIYEKKFDMAISTKNEKLFNYQYPYTNEDIANMARAQQYEDCRSIQLLGFYVKKLSTLKNIVATFSSTRNNTEQIINEWQDSYYTDVMLTDANYYEKAYKLAIDMVVKNYTKKEATALFYFNQCLTFPVDELIKNTKYDRLHERE